MLPKIAIIYLCYNMEEYVREVADALAQVSYPKDRLLLILLPAGSPDKTKDIILGDILPRSQKDLPLTILVDDPVNRGFAGNNNVGISEALAKGADYVFLHNGDLKIAPDAFIKLVSVMEEYPQAGAVQCLIRYWHQPEKVNVSGGMFHVAGYGFARDNGRVLSEISYPPVSEIAYASGAAVLYRVSALQKVGVLEEGFFMYHEDLELGMRLRFAGYSNLLVRDAHAFHDYHFSRNPNKFAWMELYRWIVLLSYFRIRTLLLLSPLLVVIEIGTWFMAFKGGWWMAKVWAYAQWFRPRTWQLLLFIRKRAQGLRAISDATYLALMTGRIEGQETSSFFLDRWVNPFIDFVFCTLRRFVCW